MAKIILNVELNSTKALSDIQKLNTELSNLGQSTSNSFGKDGISKTTASLNKLKKQTNDLFTNVKNMTSQYPQGIFSKLLKDIEKTVEAVNALKSYNKEAKELSKILSDQTVKFSQAKAAADKYSEISIAKMSKQFIDLKANIKKTAENYPTGTFSTLQGQVTKAINVLKNLDVGTDDYAKTLQKLDIQLARNKETFSDIKLNAEKVKKVINEPISTESFMSEKQLNNIKTRYNNFFSQIRAEKSKYPTGAFDSLEKEVEANITAINKLTTSTDGYTAKAKELDTQLSRQQAQFAQLRQETEQNTEKSLNNLKKNYNDFLRQISSEETKYPKGTFTNLKKEAEANVNAINNLTTGTEGYTQKAKELDTQLSAQKANFAQLRQETKQNTDAVVKHGDSISSLAKKFVLWQAAATLVMQPIQMLRSAIASVNETLTETENRVIELQRVLKEGETTAMQASDELYGLAEQYGQTFENSSQISVNFARSGMDWQDTLKATESALLALNVAELDSEEATNGLIAIMSQFKLSASDLETVVDKLNKTADNFPVTTEKLLKALQRTGSSARNANLSLDETIGLITSLSQATGRSGENLGTAINSLISYSQKAKSLDIFAQLSEETAQAVDNFRHGAGTILNVWESVSKVIETADSRQKELLNGLTEDEDIKNLDTELQDELGDIFEEVNEVYGTANTFRKSYFISLLNNINTVRDAQKVASDAEGYSQKENEKYMETYTAKVNTLKSKWEELATDEQGFLGFKKSMVELGTGLIEVIDNLGGIKTLVNLIAIGLLKAFKTQTIGKFVTFLANIRTHFSNVISAAKTFGTTLKNPIQAINNYKTALNNVALANQQLEEAQKELTIAQETNVGVTEAENKVKAAETAVEDANTAAKSANAAITSVLTAAISGVIIAYTIYSAIQRKHTENLRKQAEVAEKELETVTDLQETFKKLEEDLKNNNITFDEAKKIVNDNASEMRKLGIEVDTTASSYDKLKTAVENANKKLVKKAYTKAIGAETAAAAELENEADNNMAWGNGRKNVLYDNRLMLQIIGKLRKFGVYDKNEIELVKIGNASIKGAENILEYYDKLILLKEKLEEKAKTDDTILDDDLYKDVSEEIADLNEQVEKYRATLEQKASAEVADWLTKNDVKNAEDYNKLVKQISDGTGDWSGYSETYRKYIKDVVEQYFPQFASQTKEVAKGHKEILADLSEVSSKYEDISNALKKILDDEKDAEQLASYNEKIKEAQLDVEKAREKVADAIKEKEQAQKDLAKKQLELKKAIAKAQADYINNAIDKYIDKLDVSNDKEEKLKAIEEAKTDLAEKRLEVEEKRLELAKEEEKLAKLKEQRTIKQFSQASQSFEFVADEKKVQDQIDAVDKAREAVNSAEKAVVGAEEKIADAQNSLNDWLKNQAINEIKKYIENGGKSEKKINSILDKWLGQSGNGKLSSEMKSWKNGVTKTIDTASKKATTQNKEIKKSIESAKNAVKSAKEALKKKEQGIIDANKDVKSAIKKVDETKVDKQTYLKTQAINAVTALLSDGKSHTSKEVQSLIGSYGLSSDIEGKIWNTIVKAGGFNPSVKGTRRHWKTYDDAKKDGITGLFTLNEFNLRKKSNSKATKDYADYQAYLDAMYAKYKGGSNLYDKGGILHGLGGIKATNSPETVLDPALTKKILEPSSNSNFTNFAKSLGILFGASDNLARTSYTTNNGATNNNDNRNYTINGVPFTQQQVNTHTLGELLETAAFLRE